MSMLSVSGVQAYTTLRSLTNKICDRYRIDNDFECKRKKILFDYTDRVGENFYNMHLYSENKIEKPNDGRGFWSCGYINIISYVPLQFEVDGIIFTPFLA